MTRGNTNPGHTKMKLVRYARRPIARYTRRYATRAISKYAASASGWKGRVAGYAARKALQAGVKIAKWGIKRWRSRTSGPNKRMRFATQVSAFKSSGIDQRTINSDTLTLTPLTNLLNVAGIERNWADVTGFKICHNFTNTVGGTSGNGIIHVALVSLKKSSINLFSPPSTTGLPYALSPAQVIENHFFTTPNVGDYVATSFTDTSIPEVMKNCLPISKKYLNVHFHHKYPIQFDGFGGNYQTMRQGSGVYMEKWIPWKRRLQKDIVNNDFHPVLYEAIWIEPPISNGTAAPIIQDTYFQKVYYRKADI